MSCYIPEGYSPVLNVYDTQKAIEFIKRSFQKNLGSALNLKRVSAPLFLPASSGLNDDLSGVERPVAFDAPAAEAGELQVVQSLAKWKRWALKKYNFFPGNGLYTDMNAIRRDEAKLDNIHSVYVDQWDWEKIITKEQRTKENLHKIVKSVYDALKVTEKYVSNLYDYVECILPEDITFVTSQELEDQYPELTPKEREYKAAKLHGAIFLE